MVPSMNEAGERYCRSAGRQRHFRPQAEFEAEGLFWAPEAAGASKASSRSRKGCYNSGAVT